MLSYRILRMIGQFCVFITLTIIFTTCDALLEPEKLPPEVKITSPADSSYFIETETITFSAWAKGHDDRFLPSSHFSWSSSIDGDLGMGSTINKALSPGGHTVTVTVTEEERTARKNITVNVLGDINIQILEPENNSKYFVGDTVFYRVDIDSEYANEVVWKLNGNPINLSKVEGEIIITNIGDYNLTAEVEKEGFVWKDAVNIKILPVIYGKVFALSSKGVVDFSTTDGSHIAFRNGDEEYLSKIDSYGIFEVRVDFEEERTTNFELWINRSDIHYPSKVNLLGSRIIELSGNGELRFILYPKVWDIVKGKHSGKSVKINLADAFREPGSDIPNSNIPFYWHSAWSDIKQKTIVTSILERDAPLRAFFDRSIVDHVTPEDSVISWNVVAEMEEYLGLGNLFTPVSADEVDDEHYFVRIRVDNEGSATGMPTFDNNGNIVGGRVTLSYINSPTGGIRTRTIMHEFIHVMGIGHTCSWFSLMGTPASACEGLPDPIPNLEWPVEKDVAYIQLLYVARQLQYDESIPFGVEESWEALR